MALIWPNGSTSVPRVTSEFNPNRKHPVSGAMRPHRGIDLAGWSTIVSPVAGVVTTKAFQAGGAGNYVNIRSDGGDTFKFFHLKSASPLRVGQRVSAGTVIGVMGATGGVTGVHLHFEVWSGGKAVNPRTYYSQHGLSAEYQEDDDMQADEREALFFVRDRLKGITRDGDASKLLTTADGKVIRDDIATWGQRSVAETSSAFHQTADVLKSMSAEQVVAAIPKGIASEVADLLAKRLAS